MHRKLQFNIAAKDMANKAGMFSTSSPFAIVTVMVARNNQFYRKATVKTESVEHELSPKWLTTVDVELDEALDESMLISVKIFDRIEAPERRMGGALFDIASLQENGCFMERKMRNGGTLSCSLVEKCDAGQVKFTLQGYRLKTIDRAKNKLRTNPYFEISRDDGPCWTTIYRSEVQTNYLSPKFEQCKFELSTLCRGDLDAPLLLTVYNKDSATQNRLVGSLETSIREMMTKPTRIVRSSASSTSSVASQGGMPLRDSSGKEVGDIIIEQISVRRPKPRRRKSSGVDSLSTGCSSSLFSNKHKKLVRFSSALFD